MELVEPFKSKAIGQHPLLFYRYGTKQIGSLFRRMYLLMTFTKRLENVLIKCSVHYNFQR